MSLTLRSQLSNFKEKVNDLKYDRQKLIGTIEALFTNKHLSKTDISQLYLFIDGRHIKYLNFDFEVYYCAELIDEVNDFYTLDCLSNEVLIGLANYLLNYIDVKNEPEISFSVSK